MEHFRSQVQDICHELLHTLSSGNTKQEGRDHRGSQYCTPSFSIVWKEVCSIFRIILAFQVLICPMRSTSNHCLWTPVLLPNFKASFCTICKPFLTSLQLGVAYIKPQISWNFWIVTNSSLWSRSISQETDLLSSTHQMIYISPHSYRSFPTPLVQF
jgi:hypothetical protein